jgi:hypothetical protein
LGLGRAATCHQGTGGKRWLVGVPHVVHCGFILNPVVTAPFRAQGAAGWFGWYDNPKVEQLTQEWLDAKDEDSRKKIAATIQFENYRQAPTITLGQFQIPTAYNKNLTGQAGIHRARILERQARVTRTAARSGSGGASCGIGIGDGGSSIGTGSSGSGCRGGSPGGFGGSDSLIPQVLPRASLGQASLPLAAAPRVRGSARSTGRCPAAEQTPGASGR